MDEILRREALDVRDALVAQVNAHTTFGATATGSVYIDRLGMYLEAPNGTIYRLHLLIDPVSRPWAKG